MSLLEAIKPSVQGMLERNLHKASGKYEHSGLTEAMR